MERRKFFKSTGMLTAAGFFTTQFPFIASPFVEEDFMNSRIPVDEKLDPAWVKSLYERGKITSYKKSKNELRYIGMPVGGICSGCVYLAGDGRLWLWDIFNENQYGVVAKTLPIKLSSFNLKGINNGIGSLYLEPLTEVRRLQQGFVLAVMHHGTTTIKRLLQDDWEEVIFEATYPVTTIRYIDKHFPLEVTLEAFFPFTPGDAQESGMLATIQAISFKNPSDSNVSIEVHGWINDYKTKLKSALGALTVQNLLHDSVFVRLWMLHQNYLKYWSLKLMKLMSIPPCLFN